MTPLAVAATLLGMSELALAGDGAVDAARPAVDANGLIIARARARSHEGLSPNSPPRSAYQRAVRP